MAISERLFYDLFHLGALSLSRHDRPAISTIFYDYLCSFSLLLRLLRAAFTAFNCRELIKPPID
jgi:hypothetical protein